MANDLLAGDPIAQGATATAAVPPLEREAVLPTPAEPLPPRPEFRAAPAAPLPRFNPQREETRFLERAGAGAKLTPTGRVGFIERNRPGQVFTDPEGAVFIFDPETNEVFPFDRPQFTIQDVADVTADIIQAGLQLFGGPSPVTQAGIAALGEAGRQAVSEMLPGEEELSIEGRLLRLGATSAAAGLGQGAVNLGFRAIDRLRPHNIIARQVQRLQERPFAQQGRRLRERTGVELTPGEETGSRSLLQAEGLVRQHPVSSDQVFMRDQLRLKNSLRFVNRQIDDLLDGGAGAEEAGNLARQSFDDLVETALSQRSRVAKADFQAVADAATEGMTLPVPNAIAAVDDLIRRFDVPGGGDAAASLVSKLKNLRSVLSGAAPKEGDPIASALFQSLTGAAPAKAAKTPRNLTPDQFQRLLQIYGNAARGSGRIFQDVDTAQQRLIARELFDALRTDLDDIVEAGATGGPVAEALRVARDNYRQNSAAVNDLANSVLGRMFGGRVPPSPEGAATRIARMQPSELRTTMAMLERASPATAQRVKGFMIADALEKAGAPTSGRAPATGILGFSPKRAAQNIVKSPVWEVMTRPERAAIANGVRLLERLADRAGMTGSQTAPLQFTMQLGRALLGGAAAFSPAQIAETVGTLFVPRRIANMLFKPGAIQALQTLVSTGPRTRTFTNAAAFMSGLMAEDAGEENIRPNPELQEAIPRRSARPAPVDLLETR